MKKFYLLLLLFYAARMYAQTCSGLSLTYATSESRCMATGSITVNVTGGSGNYNYKVTGPITPPVTSSNVITGLPSGYYSLTVKDLTNNCFIQKDSLFVAGSYSDPRFTLIKTDPGCSGNDGTISAANLQFGRSPFTYTIISPSPSSVGQSNSTGSFTGLISGEYYIQLTDSCGGIQVRRITIETYIWSFDLVSITKVGCDSADAFIRLKDNKGNTNVSGTVFNGYKYGIIRAVGDTSWFTTNSFRFYIGHNKSVTVAVRDNCGNINTYFWMIPANLRPSIGGVNISGSTCTTFNAAITNAQNLTSPTFCLYDSLNNVISCNTSGQFNAIPYGRYCIKVTDPCYDTTISNCFSNYHGVPAVGNSITISNKDCNGFMATVTGQVNLTNPNYCLYTSADALIFCNNNGIFYNLPYGSYCIKIHDGCIDTTIVRCFTVTKPVAVLTSANIYGSTCSGFNVSVTGNNLNNPYYCLYDSLGNVVACDSTGTFTGLTHGHYCVKAVSCGDTTNSICFSSQLPVPALGNVSISNLTCSGFTATVTGQSNLTQPYYCLYDSLNNVVACDSTGIFNNIPYGSYCIKMHDGCMDTTITRCFSKYHAVPTVSATLQQYNWSCTAFSTKVTGTNLTSPSYCLYDSLNNLVKCDSTGSFDNIPFGRYCVVVHDGCIDTTFTICQTFNPVHGFTVTSAKNCSIGISKVTVKFNNANPPFNVKVYHPNGSKVFDSTTNSNSAMVFYVPALAGGQYKVVGSDFCGNKDSVLFTPDATVLTKSSTVQSKCPSGAYLNGAGDVNASASSNYYPLTPLIISKNGASFTKNYSSYNANVYTFSDLEPATYIVEYTMQTCLTKIDDTVTVNPYVYPTQGQSAIYQCDNNGFSLGADVKGGVTPYTYQIIGSTPTSPSITTQAQTSSVFNIDNGTEYSLVRLRSVDACGNATLNDVSVLPLQNISITATSNCFYQNTTLLVDTIPNASYSWYKRTTSTDSVLLGTGLTYNLPFLMPEQAGQYICKTVVNNGCATRLANFNLTGNCGYIILAIPIELKGKHEGNNNLLNWNNTDPSIVSVIIERKSGMGDFIRIDEISTHLGSNQWIDRNPSSNSFYRLKVNYSGKYGYTNIVHLYQNETGIQVYPNPVLNDLNIEIHSTTGSDYAIQIINSAGQTILNQLMKNCYSSIYTFRRINNAPGVYIVRITDQNTGMSEIKKIIFK
jgi:hypothetical protein